MKRQRPPWFISLEGGEGAGKSTQVGRLVERFKEIAIECLATREPGGSPGAEEIRGLLVTGETARWTATAEALLNYAARDDHLTSVIRPALQQGTTVICDRFMDSTRVYQGVAGDAPLGLLDRLEEFVVGDERPDLTLILDLDTDTGLARAHSRGTGSEDRFERMGSTFHAKLRQGFLQIAKREPDRCAVIDASVSEDEVAQAIWETVSSRLIG